MEEELLGNMETLVGLSINRVKSRSGGRKAQYSVRPCLLGA